MAVHFSVDRRYLVLNYIMVKGSDAMSARVSRLAIMLFGLPFSPLSAADISKLIADHIRAPDENVGLLITPNIQHIALMRTNEEFRRACEQAEILTCDGFPLYYYGRCRGLPLPGRVTGREITEDLMSMPSALRKHRIFAVVDSERTGKAVVEWARAHGLDDRFSFYVPAVGFENDPTEARHLARLIRDHATSLLFMGVGAPRSELFVSRYKDDLPPCWALCIGQSLIVALGLLPKPPVLVQRLNLEWLWRIALEPRRLAKRYVWALSEFLIALFKDLSRVG
ncbi:WecB/TagA/CpsF family glycosyltransferase [Gluconacetobacter sacchari]|uniref:WecB/TagA/CpsF family glycosyltransferase n=3 Tax=Gluconacetobacter sacchari TaxID=92759 RepID=A0A7W4IA10_9PROT|nr:WecB/TagA/CpsF family glycosyltransferase [Gluconacetobacter sacchari]MBB2159008.1 WecB/TagA/CpsF family glycosyltransferase [Gluconacetobacter sacchari]